MFFSLENLNKFVDGVIKKTLNPFKEAIKKSEATLLGKLLSREFPQQQKKWIKIDNGKHGDFSIGKPFPKIAKEIIEQIEKEGDQLIKMGFLPTVQSIKDYVNFSLDMKQVHKFFANVAEQKKSNEESKSYFIEFVSANPTGPLHIGHGRWAVVGSILVNVLRWKKHRVLAEFYVNDCGIQIEKLRESAKRIRENTPLEEDHYGGSYMEVFRENKEDPKDYFIKDHKKILEKMKVNFDNFFLESDLHKESGVKNSIINLTEMGLTYEKDGALWFKSSEYGDEKDRVLQKADGSYTYFAVDVAYHANKLKRKSTKNGDGEYSEYINILGADHHGYAIRIKAAFDAIKAANNKKNPQKIPNPQELQVVLGQLVSLFRGGKPVRMSKRSGDMVALEEVLEEIGVDATRYFLSMRALNTPLSFDLDVVTKKSAENPLYYVQYAHARICSVQKKALENGIKECSLEEFDYDKIGCEDLRIILRKLLMFDDMLETVVERLEVYILPTYLYELSAAFHSWYEKNRFIQEDEQKSGNYLCVLKVIKKVLSRGLQLMGICPVDSM